MFRISTSEKEIKRQKIYMTKIKIGSLVLISWFLELQRLKVYGGVALKLYLIEFKFFTFRYL